MSASAEYLEDSYGKVAAIWILASRDKDPTMSYESIRFRLGLRDITEARMLVGRHPELFRKRIPQPRLPKIKAHYANNGMRDVAWLMDISEDERRERVDSLTADDFFRSQFRTLPAEPASPDSLIEWGLSHLDRIRKAGIEAKDLRIKARSSWIPAIASAIAALSLAFTVYMQKLTLDNQERLKTLELSFAPKQRHYENLITGSWSLFESASHGQAVDVNNQIAKVEGDFYAIEPFLNSSERNVLYEMLQSFEENCLSIVKQKGKSPTNDQIDGYITWIRALRTRVGHRLFH